MIHIFEIVLCKYPTIQETIQHFTLRTNIFMLNIVHSNMSSIIMLDKKKS